MADTSNYTIEKRVIASCWVHERNQTGKTIEELVLTSCSVFSGNLLRNKHFCNGNKLFFTGSVKDKERSGRPSTRGEQCRLAEESVESSPQKSMCKQSADSAHTDPLDNE